MNFKKCDIISKWIKSNIFLFIVGWKMIYGDEKSPLPVLSIKNLVFNR